MSLIRVVNKRFGASSRTSDVYIGRPSCLGNPYVIGRDGTREDVITKYEAWLRAKRADPSPKGAAVRDALAGIAAKAQAGTVHLVCWCAPLGCHGDVIVKLLNEEGL